jgi:hypothetical protein
MLGAARRTDLISAGLTLLAVAALIFRFGSVVSAIAAVALGVAGRYFGFRVALDRRLFADLADGRMQLAELDAALRSATGGAAGSSERSVADRCRGARRLVGLHAMVTAAQLLVVALAPLLP